MEKNLIFFTACYPNTSGEVFVENEIRFLENYFNNITIICASKKKGDSVRYIPKNANVFVFDENLSFYQKFRGIILLFKRVFWNEIKFSKKNLHVNFTFFHYKILYIELIKAYLLSKYTCGLCDRFPPESIYFYSYWSDYKAIACALLKKKYPASKSFTRNHGWDIYFYVHNHKYLPLRNFIFTNLDAIYCISQHGFDYIRNDLKFKINNLYISKLGTYNDFPINKSLNNSSSLLIVSCSNLVPLKRIELLIDSLSLIPNIPITWFHFGDGFLKTSLINLSQKLHVHKNIKFEFKGEVSNRDLMIFYKCNKVDIFLNVSKSEGIPVSIMEAISFGIPIIATSVGGTPEIVQGGYNGFLISENPSPKEIAEAITIYYNLSVEEKNKMQQNAYNTWIVEFNAKINYKKFVDHILIA